MTGKNVSHKVAMILPYWWINQAKHSVNGTDIHLYGGISEFLEKIKATHDKEFSRVVIFEFGGTLPDYSNKYLTTDNYATDLYQGILSRGEHKIKIRSLRKRFFDEEDNPPYVVFEGFEEEDPIEQENQLRYISPNYKEHDERYKLLEKYYEEYANNYSKLETIYVAADNEKPEIFPDISSNLYWYLAELSGDEHMSRNTYYIPADHEEIDVQLIETLATGEYNAIAGLTSEDDYEISEKHIPNQREVDLDEFFTNIQDALEGDPEEDEDDNVQSPNFDSDWDDSGVNGTEVWGSDGGFESPDDEDFNDDDENVQDDSPQEDPEPEEEDSESGFDTGVESDSGTLSENEVLQVDDEIILDSSYPVEDVIPHAQDDLESMGQEHVELVPEPVIPEEPEKELVEDEYYSEQDNYVYDTPEYSKRQQVTNNVASLNIISGSPGPHIADATYELMPETEATVCVVSLSNNGHGALGSVKHPPLMYKAGHRLSLNENPYEDDGVFYYTATSTHPYGSLRAELDALKANLLRLVNMYDMVIVESSTPSVLDIIPEGMDYNLKYVFGASPDSLYHYLDYTSVIPSSVRDKAYQSMSISLPEETRSEGAGLLYEAIQERKADYIPFNYNWLEKISR